MRILRIVALLCAPLLPAGAQDDGTLARQLAEVRRATEVYRDVDAARRDGYRLLGAAADAPLMGEHWVNRELMDRPLDLLRPSVLQYVRVGDHRVLVGVTYGRRQRAGDPLPEGFAGGSDVWHVHDLPELVERLTRHRTWYVRQAASRRLDAIGAGEDGRPALAMLHVWLYSENPDGMFANYNPALPYLRAGLPAGWARAGDHAAARGVELLAPGACERMAGRFRWLAGVDAARASDLRERCGHAAAEVAGARGGGAEGEALNAAAARAWRGLAAGTLAALTPEQRRELAALRGGMGGGGHEHGGER